MWVPLPNLHSKYWMLVQTDRATRSAARDAQELLLTNLADHPCLIECDEFRLLCYDWIECPLQHLHRPQRKSLSKCEISSTEFLYASRRTDRFTPMNSQDKYAASPEIECRAGVMGGDPCIAGTRIPVWLLVVARRIGSSDEDLLKAHPTLSAEDLTNAWASYRLNRIEIEQRIAENEAA